MMRFMVWTVVLFILVLAILVVVHEFGHFFVARRAGIAVEEFGFGFPPRLWACKGRVCEWSVNWLPFGGFVKLKGEDGRNRDDDSYASKGPLVRAAVVAAGPIMNLVLAAVLFWVGYVIGAPQVVHDGLPEGARVSDVSVQVIEVVAGSAAERLGFRVGDEIVGVAEVSDVRAAAVIDAIRSLSAAGAATFMVEREGDVFEVVVSADALDAASPVLGVALVDVGVVRYGVIGAAVRAVEHTIDMTRAVVVGLYGFLRALVVGDGVVGDVAGPVGIAAITGEVAKAGFAHLVQFVAILSVNLGVLNLVPIPALDGGRLLFVAIELVLRKPVSRRVEQTAHVVGFAALMILILVVTAQDISRFMF